MAARRYITLLASLPHLPHFERAEMLPINPERLDGRLGMLEDEDARLVERARAFLIWQRQPIERSDAEVVARHAALVREVRDPLLLAMIDFRMQVRTVMAALRRRQRGEPPPRPGEVWGVGPFVGQIERHWSEPDFGLAGVHPWLPEARRLLETGEPLPLQRLLMGVVWDQLTRLETGEVFTLGALLIYLFKWDILARWLAYDEALAAARFETLLRETLAGHASAV